MANDHDEQRHDDSDSQHGGQPESAESGASRELSEKVPEGASGEGGTPLGATDQHSDAPGPHGLGD